MREGWRKENGLMINSGKFRRYRKQHIMNYSVRIITFGDSIGVNGESIGVNGTMEAATLSASDSVRTIPLVIFPSGFVTCTFKSALMRFWDLLLKVN